MMVRGPTECEDRGGTSRNLVIESPATLCCFLIDQYDKSKKQAELSWPDDPKPGGSFCILFIGAVRLLSLETAFGLRMLQLWNGGAPYAGSADETRGGKAMMRMLEPTPTEVETRWCNMKSFVRKAVTFVNPSRLLGMLDEILVKVLI